MSDIDPRAIKDPTTHLWFALGGLIVTILLAIVAPPLAGFTLLLTIIWGATALVRARRLLRYMRGRDLDE